MTDFATFAERERSGWSEPDIVSAYVAKFGPVVDAAGAVMVDRYRVKGKRVLDLCCGHGNLTALLAEAGADVTGLDFSPEMLSRARDALPDVRFVEADAAQMPFEASSYDFVFNNFGMMHLPNATTALNEVSRVLAPGGTFAMATWDAPTRSPAFGTVFGALKSLADFANAPAQPDLFAFTDAKYAQQTLHGSGLHMTAHDCVLQAWVVKAPEDFFDIFLTATVGAAMLIKSQDAKTIEAIRENITRKVAETYQDGDRYRIPVPVCIATAVKNEGGA